MDPRDYKSKWPEVLRDLSDKTESILIDSGVAPELAATAARQLLDKMRYDWGGQYIYFPKGDSIELPARDIEFYSRWDGTSEHLATLCMEYRISLQWGYKIIRSVREHDKSQRDLF